MTIEIQKAKPEDFEAIWSIFKKVIASGDSYIYPPETTKEQARDIWMNAPDVSYVAKEGDVVVGTYVIRPNKVGRGSHVCNAGFMVHPDHRRKGIGRLMGEHALKEAKNIGYHAMQFNVVVSTNQAAVSLWQLLGFKIIGTVPAAFRHEEKGYVDIHIMHQFL